MGTTVETYMLVGNRLEKENLLSIAKDYTARNKKNFAENIEKLNQCLEIMPNNRDLKVQFQNLEKQAWEFWLYERLVEDKGFVINEEQHGYEYFGLPVKAVIARNELDVFNKQVLEKMMQFEQLTGVEAKLMATHDYR